MGSIDGNHVQNPQTTNLNILGSTLLAWIHKIIKIIFNLLDSNKKFLGPMRLVIPYGYDSYVKTGDKRTILQK